MTATMALVFIESRDKKLYALEASTGRKVWEFEGNRRGFFFPMVHLDRAEGIFVRVQTSIGELLSEARSSQLREVEEEGRRYLEEELRIDTDEAIEEIDDVLGEVEHGQY